MLFHAGSPKLGHSYLLFERPIGTYIFKKITLFQIKATFDFDDDIGEVHDF